MSFDESSVINNLYYHGSEIKLKIAVFIFRTCLKEKTLQFLILIQLVKQKLHNIQVTVVSKKLMFCYLIEF